MIYRSLLKKGVACSCNKSIPRFRCAAINNRKNIRSEPGEVMCTSLLRRWLTHCCECCGRCQKNVKDYEHGKDFYGPGRPAHWPAPWSSDILAPFNPSLQIWHLPTRVKHGMSPVPSLKHFTKHTWCTIFRQQSIRDYSRCPDAFVERASRACKGHERRVTDLPPDLHNDVRQ